ncbi:chromatin assembly factor 1 subunit A-domain-containing protein [Xylariaceae sp. FL0662B]|nr:chromatin assembly factor 1 subunit A-domain-containing protein [Xylariaceae sp. FL0662B]
MPLFALSPNIQESETASRKRTHDEYVDAPIQLAVDDSENIAGPKSLEMSTSAINSHPRKFTFSRKRLYESSNNAPAVELSSVPVITMTSTPGSSPAPLTEAGSSPPDRDSPSPNPTPSKSLTTQNNITETPTQSGATVPPAPTVQTIKPAKRKLTAAEKEQERVEKRQKKEAEAAEKARLAEQKEAEKIRLAAQKETERVAKMEEKARINAEREAVKLAKAEAKARVDAEKEAKRHKKEEEELAARRKQEKQKNMLASFFKRPPSSPPKKSDERVTRPSPKPDASPVAPKEDPRPQRSAYERTFQPFFIKPGVTLAPTPFHMDEETKEVKSGILDEYIRGERGEFNPKPFNPKETFNLPFTQRRGILLPSVRKIMESVYGDSYENAFGLTKERTESQTAKLVLSAQDRLNLIPMKSLCFYEDVRPPYFGTMTTAMSTSQLRQLTRRPTGRLLPLTYDYDSEAEWVEDDGEDLDELEDEEEEHEGDEEMDDFLDDSDDVPAPSRPTFLGENEPTSTGICFEDRKRLGPSATMYKYKLEFLLDTLEHHSEIDPFSTAYWPSAARKPAAKSTAAPAPIAPTSAPHPGAPTDQFAMLSCSSGSTAGAGEAKEFVPKEVFDDFKRAVVSDELREFTKSTLVEMLAKKFSNCTKAQVKATLDKIAQRVSVPGAKKSVKHWALLPGFAL